MIRHPVPAIVFGLILLFAVAIACQPAAVSADEPTPTPTATATSTPSPTPTATPLPTGSITITVNAPFCSPIVSQCPQFGFVVANGALPSFNLPEQRGSYTHVYNNVAPGFYAISETFAGLPLASIYCSSDRGFNQQQASAQGVSIGIPIRGNEHATCTLTNALPTPPPTQALSLTVNATPTPSVALSSFPATATPAPPAAPVVNNYFAAPVPTQAPAVPAAAPAVAPAAARFSAPNTGDGGLADAPRLTLDVATGKSDGISTDSAAAALAGAPLIMGLVQLFKGTLPIPNRYMSLLTFVTGFAWTLGTAYATSDLVKGTLVLAVTVGLSVSGLYEVTTTALANKSPPAG